MKKLDAGLASRTVAELMVTKPKTHHAETHVEGVRDAFEDPHVHMVLLMRDSFLRGTLLRADVPSALPLTATALSFATLQGRTIGPDEGIAEVHQRLVRTGQRRLAVVDADSRLLGLLCLKRDQTGFCDDQGVAERAFAINGMVPGQSCP